MSITTTANDIFDQYAEHFRRQAIKELLRMKLGRTLFGGKQPRLSPQRFYLERQSAATRAAYLKKEDYRVRRGIARELAKIIAEEYGLTLDDLNPCPVEDW